MKRRKNADNEETAGLSPYGGIGRLHGKSAKRMECPREIVQVYNML